MIVAPNLWAGFGPIRPGPAGLGIVGGYEQVAERIDDLINIGVEGFILSGAPALEEALRVGEEVLPLVRGSSRSSLPSAECLPKI